MVWEKKHNDGILFDMVANNMTNFVSRKHIRFLSVRSNDAGEEWAVLQTDKGIAYLIEQHDMRKYRLKYLINNIKNNGS